MYQVLTDVQRTVADANVDPPRLHFNNAADDLYYDNKTLFLMFHTLVPITLQVKIEQDAADRCTRRKDELLRYSAYYMFRVIMSIDEELAARHLARLKTLKCTDIRLLQQHAQYKPQCKISQL